MKIKKIILAICLSLSLLTISPNTKLQDIITTAEQGDAHAQFNLGIMYYSGLEIAQDYKKQLHGCLKLPSRIILMLNSPYALSIMKV